MTNLFAALAAASAVAASQPPAPSAFEASAPQQSHANQSNRQAAELKGDAHASSPSIVNIDQPLSRQPATSHEPQDRERESPWKGVWEAIVALATLALAVVTMRLVSYTKKLWNATVDLSKEAKATSDRQAMEMQNSLSIAGEMAWEAKESTAASIRSAAAAQRSADALVSTAMPVLFPKVLSVEGPPFVFGAKISIIFENFGSTPATIREVRAKIYVTFNNGLPEFNSAEWDTLAYPHVIPGSSNSAQVKPLEIALYIRLDVPAIEEYFAEESDERYRRLVLMGRVVYDDLFGWRHERTFCIRVRAKMRPTEPTVQIGVGGRAYNGLKKYQIPDADPLP